ncbi:MAG TPA: hypothetical protein VLJ86_21595 [Ramlibacter sp.]|nr:hypothetical protein [Ramlibacter sp.]
MNFDAKNFTMAGLRSFKVADAKNLEPIQIDAATKAKTSGLRGMFAGREVRALVTQSKDRDVARADAHIGMRRVLLAQYGSEAALNDALGRNAGNDDEAGVRQKKVMLLIKAQTLPIDSKGSKSDPLIDGMGAFADSKATLDAYDVDALGAWDNGVGAQRNRINFDSLNLMKRGALLAALKDSSLLELAKSAGLTDPGGTALKPEVAEKITQAYHEALKSVTTLNSRDQLIGPLRTAVRSVDLNFRSDF